MSLTVLPTIVFDSSGSDTAASGAGPATALSGSAANVTSGSATVTITDAVNLAGVATDGSAVLWVNTASGRQWSRISALSGSSGNWTLTVEDSVWTTSANKTWGIGGKRATLDDTNSRKLFSADAKAGWTLQVNNNQSLAGGTLTINSVGDTTTGPVVLTGNSDSPRPVITQTTNAAVFQTSGTGGRWNISKLALQNNGATKTGAHGISVANAGWTLNITDCVVGDATNSLQIGVRIGSGTCVCALVDCEVKNCAGDGIANTTGTAGNHTLDGCNIHGNGGCGFNNTTNTSSVTIQNSTIYGNASDGVALTGTVTAAQITDNVIDGNGGNGVNLGANVHSQLVLYNNNITGNSLYGATSTAGAMDACKSFVDYNCFGSGSAADGPANTSGAYQNLTAGAHDKVGVSPNYAGRGSSPPNFTNSSASNVKAKGFPDATRTVGGNTGGTTAHDDIGVQHVDAGGAAGLLVPFGMTGGCNG